MKKQDIKYRKTISNASLSAKELFWEPKYTAKSLPGLSSRLLKHYNEQGYLLTQRTDNKWFKFSFVEYVWVLILQDISQSGAYISKNVESLLKHYSGIERMPEKGHWQKGENKEEAVVRFGRDLIESITAKKPLFIRFYQDERCEILWHETVEMPSTLWHSFDLQARMAWESYLQVSVFGILTRLLITGKFDEILVVGVLHNNERELLKHARQNELTFVNVMVNENETISLKAEGQRPEDLVANVNAIFHWEGYEAIEYATSEGKKVEFKRIGKNALSGKKAV